MRLVAPLIEEPLTLSFGFIVQGIMGLCGTQVGHCTEETEEHATEQWGR
jgi:hypothetical protein